MRDVAGKRVTVMGLGRFGGGVAVTRWLAHQGAHVTVSDAAPADALEESVATIQDCVDNGSVRLALGNHIEKDFAAADLIVANPAVPKPWENQYLRIAQRNGVPITTEIRLLVDSLPVGVTTIGVTGSAGKSTTSAMVAHALRAMGTDSPRTVWLGGNIGGSLLDDVAQMKPNDIVVLELSSAMLYWLAGRDDASPWGPDIGAITSIAPNHIDWHGDISHYLRSKSSIAAFSRDVCVLDDEDVIACASECDDAHLHVVQSSDTRGIASDTLRVPGVHNQHNALLAASIVSLVLTSDTTTKRNEAVRALHDFAGLADRLERVSIEHAPTMLVYNDSKSTTPQATQLAVDAIKQSHPSAGIHLIAGGYDKGVSLDAIAALMRTHAIGGLYPIGVTGDMLASCAPHGNCKTLERAVSIAIEHMRDGDVLLLSPGCASWDQFDDYRQRGRRFVECVNQIVNAQQPKVAHK